jgi:Bifunctional DNA primase/polymerase, N-terminal
MGAAQAVNALTAGEDVLVDRLRAAAVAYVKAGWPILPLSLTGDRLVAGRSPLDVRMAADWWSQRPYGIGCRLGDEFDVLEVPVGLGEAVLVELRRVRPLASVPPVVEVPGQDCWLFLVTPGFKQIPELPARGPIHLHSGEGRWIVLPPTPLTGGPVSWIGAEGTDAAVPNPTGLPHSLTVQWAASHALRRHHRDALPERIRPVGVQRLVPGSG